MVVMMALSQLVQSTAQETLKMSFGIFFLPVIEDKKDIGKRMSPSFLLSPHQIIDSGAVVRLCFFYAERKTPNINRLVLIVLP